MSTLCYIDPASTALIWQVLAGVFISLGVVFGVFWRKMSTFFKALWVKLFRKNKNQEVEKVDESVLEVEDEISENTENVEVATETSNNKSEEVQDEQNTESENK